MKITKIVVVDRKHMSYKQAKRFFPKLKPNGDIDRDGVKNSKDCRPFNKKKHSITIRDGESKTMYITPREMTAMRLIRYGREMGLPPTQTHKEMKEHGLTGVEMRGGLSAYIASKKGAYVEEGSITISGVNDY